MRFLRTLKITGTGCASNPAGAMHNPFGSATGKLQLRGVAAFPATVDQAPELATNPARPSAATPADRRIGYATWMAVSDAVDQVPRMTTPQGRGLRGGSYTVTVGAGSETFDYDAARFTDDVAVSGTMQLDAHNLLSGRVRVTVDGRSAGYLAVRAVLWDPAHPRALLTGRLNGDRVVLIAPTR